MSHSYSDKLVATKQYYPFDEWRHNFKLGLEQYTEQNCLQAKFIMDRLIYALIVLGEDAWEIVKVAQFKEAVLSLNELNDHTDGAFIETGEREQLFVLFEKIASAAGIESQRYGGGEGIASEWRDW